MVRYMRVKFLQSTIYPANEYYTLIDCLKDWVEGLLDSDDAEVWDCDTDTMTIN